MTAVEIAYGLFATVVASLVAFALDDLLLLVGLWLPLAAISGWLWTLRGHAAVRGYALSLIASPIISVAVLLVLTPNPEGLKRRALTHGKKQCPACAEMIQAEAIRCRYCGQDQLATSQRPDDPDFKRRAESAPAFVRPGEDRDVADGGPFSGILVEHRRSTRRRVAIVLCCLGIAGIAASAYFLHLKRSRRASVMDVCVEACELQVRCEYPDSTSSDAMALKRRCPQECREEVPDHCPNARRILEAWKTCPKSCAGLASCDLPSCDSDPARTNEDEGPRPGEEVVFNGSTSQYSWRDAKGRQRPVKMTADITACFEYSIALADFCGRCTPTTPEDEMDPNSICWDEGDGLRCPYVHDIRDRSSLLNDCVPWMSHASCRDYRRGSASWPDACHQPMRFTVESDDR